MKSNQFKATITLGIVSLGFLASYPFSQTLVGGVLASGCQAAMIGGLADWFAVTALFRKPLGIPFRTAIIPRNRERIFQALITMVESELLTSENLIKELEQYNFAKLLIQYLEQHGGQDAVKAIIHRVGLDLLDKLDSEDAGVVVEQLMISYAKEIKVTPVIVQIMEWSMQSGYADRFILFILNELIRIIKQDELKSQLAAIMLETQKSYERNSVSRQLVSVILDISPQQLAEVAQKKLLEIMEGMKDSNHPQRVRLKQWLEKGLLALKTDVQWHTKVEAWKLKMIEQIDVDKLGHLVGLYLQQLVGTGKMGGILKMLRWSNRQMDDLIIRFKESAGQQAELDQVITAVFRKLVIKHHGQVGITVKLVLDKFTNAMLVGFIEDKVGDDLQMIRINGSIIGGLVGILIFLLNASLQAVMK